MDIVAPAPSGAARGFRSLEHTADKAIEAWGPDLGQLFAAAQTRGLRVG